MKNTKAQVIMPIAEYEELMKHKKQNENDRNTWQQYFQEQLAEERKEHDAKLLDARTKYQDELKNIIEKAIHNKTYTLVFFSSINGRQAVIPNNDPESSGELVANSIWKLLPTDKIGPLLKFWIKYMKRASFWPKR